MTKFPIPDAALDDRLGIVGTSGAGKTYAVLGAIERLLAREARVVAIDPLGVMWGLRLMADGKTASPFGVVIFGGEHGDLPLTEGSGALLGETVAKMRESCIVDLSELPTKEAERRFMQAFLDSIYHHTERGKTDPYHLIVDEADLFAPQKPPKGWETLLNRMEQIVRRGRVKGFIPWLVTQRSAVINKDVLSQVDGLVAMKLTSSQDRDQLGDWVEGQADKAQWKAMRASLPTLQRGQAIVWIPARSMLETVQFPAKETFDSSRAPRRGERRTSIATKPLDVEALKAKIATVEIEAKANDPRALKAEIAKLKGELAKAPKASLTVEKINTTDAKVMEEARRGGFEEGWMLGDRAGWDRGTSEANKGWNAAIKAFPAPFLEYVAQAVPFKHRRTTSAPVAQPVERLASNQKIVSSNPVVRSGSDTNGSLNGPQTRILQSLWFWKSIGHDAPTKNQVAAVAGYSPIGGAFGNPIGALRAAGLIDYPRPGAVSLTDAAPSFEMSAAQARDKLMSVLDGPQKKLIAAFDGRDGDATRQDIADAAGYSPIGGAFGNPAGALCTLGIFEKPSPGMLRLSDWAREVLS